MINLYVGDNQWVEVCNRFGDISYSNLSKYCKTLAFKKMREKALAKSEFLKFLKETESQTLDVIKKIVASNSAFKDKYN